MLVGIPHDQVDKCWSIVSPILQRGIARNNGDYELSDVYHGLMRRDMQLWAWITDNNIRAACITQILHMHHKRVCLMLLVAGTGLKDFAKTQDIIADWARGQGCSQMECNGRDGWLRVLKNWKKVWTTIRRDI